MPVQETGDGIAELTAGGLPVGGVVMNMVRPQDLDDEDREQLLTDSVDRGGLVTSLDKVGIDAEETLVDALIEEGRHHAERRRLEDTQRKLVEEMNVPSFELRLLPGGIDLACLYELAEALTEEGLA
jgi:hypothetical protein